LFVSKHRALDILKREATARKFAPDLGPLLESEWTLSQTVDEAFDVDGITDVQLRMMFSCIHPQLPEKTQLALVLHLVCGFGMDETAAAFLKKGAAMQSGSGEQRRRLRDRSNCSTWWARRTSSRASRL
jgi:RNA polymerase sigma-70 factor (ECF subfamily)